MPVVSKNTAIGKSTLSVDIEKDLIATTRVSYCLPCIMTDIYIAKQINSGIPINRIRIDAAVSVPDKEPNISHIAKSAVK